jgi:hypothetical protein
MTSYDLQGNSLESILEGKQVRRKRARPFDPNNLKTWHEVNDLTPRLKERLRMGGWVAWHVRKQGDRANWGDERRGDRRAGILETIPSELAVLDWVCVPTEFAWHNWTDRYSQHPRASEGISPEAVMWIETKSESGKLTELQARTALHLAVAGQEVAVLRPRHFIGLLGEPDLAFVRLVQHRRPPAAWSAVLVQPEWSVADVIHNL